MTLEFEIRPVKFADGIKGVEVSVGDLNKVGDERHSIAYSYVDSVDKYTKIEQAKRELLDKVK